MNAREEPSAASASPKEREIVARLSIRDIFNLYRISLAVKEVIAFDRGRCSGHGWEEMVEAWDDYWQERTHPFDDSEAMAARLQSAGHLLADEAYESGMEIGELIEERRASQARIAQQEREG